MRTFHRVAGAVLAAQLVAWIVTGLLFNVKFRYDEAFETLTPARLAVDSEAAWASPADALAAVGVAPGALRRLHLLHDNRGQLYLIEAETGGAAALYLADARTGNPSAPLDAAGAEAALRSALAASRNAARYGAVESAEPVQAPSAILGRETDGWQLALDTGQAVTVNAYTSEITHTGFLNRFIDWTYRVHYMQYTPWKAVNIALICVFSALALFMVVSGLTMLRGPRRRYGYSKRRIRL